MAGTIRGREAIFRFLARLPKETNGTYESQLIDVLAPDRAAALYRASGERAGRASTSTRCCSSASRRARHRGARAAVRSRRVRRVLGSMSAVSRVP